jgi:RNA polymerase-interacting CarD/CdnL/TRCF family regulator
MVDEIKSFRKGDWVSHLHHGVGQVEGKEKKILDGESREYYKVSTRNGTYWIPTDNLDPSRIRPVVSERNLQKAIAILESPAEQMDKKHTVRKARINQVIEQGDLNGFCTLLRDLQGKKVAVKLNTTEQRAQTAIKKKIAAEWSATREITSQEAMKEVNKIIRKIKAPETVKKTRKTKAKK